MGGGAPGADRRDPESGAQYAACHQPDRYGRKPADYRSLHDDLVGGGAVQGGGDLRGRGGGRRHAAAPHQALLEATTDQLELKVVALYQHSVAANPRGGKDRAARRTARTTRCGTARGRRRCASATAARASSPTRACSAASSTGTTRPPHRRHARGDGAGGRGQRHGEARAAQRARRPRLRAHAQDRLQRQGDGGRQPARPRQPAAALRLRLLLRPAAQVRVQRAAAAPQHRDGARPLRGQQRGHRRLCAAQRRPGDARGGRVEHPRRHPAQ